MKESSGLLYLRKLIAAGDASPMGVMLGMRLVEVSDGEAVVEAVPSPKFYNYQMRMHGGYAATLIDTGLGCAVQTKLDQGVGYGTIELKVNYVRKLVAETGTVRCTGKVIHAGRTMFTAEARIAGLDGKLYAHGSGTFLVYP
jgi:acyl-CoA thioesterase